MTNREIVKNFCATRWSDQKLAEIYAFNEDGKTDYVNCMACILGLDASGIPTAAVLRGDLTKVYDSEIFYKRKQAYRDNRTLYRNIELAYLFLDENGSSEQLRRIIFGDILREIMQEREAAKDSEKVLDKAPQLALV